MRLVFAFLSIAFAAAAVAADGPYNETADAKGEIRQALSQSATTGTPVVVVFGANWCGDCKVLDIAMRTGKSAPLFARDFKVVKVDVGKFDRNVDVAEAYSVPLKKGIPAVVILSPASEILYATRGGELADARNMGEDGIYQFFRKVTDNARPGKAGKS
jgi:thioredoxin 1